VNQNPSYSPLTRKAWMVVIAILVLAVMAAALPQQVNAASCKTIHTVQKGDKTGTIANKYGLKWIEIAAANNLSRPYELEVGQQLCIPFKFSVSLKNNIAVWNVNNLIRITASDFPASGSYYVKVRDITAGPGQWYKLGNMKINKNRTVTSDFLLPKQLNSSTVFQVCLKNGTDNELICKNVRHIFK
jgi:murein DD-endopeptidase MepM/ murein hydrolase activator NlpD